MFLPSKYWLALLRVSMLNPGGSQAVMHCSLDLKRYVEFALWSQVSLHPYVTMLRFLSLNSTHFTTHQYGFFTVNFIVKADKCHPMRHSDNLDAHIETTHFWLRQEFAKKNWLNGTYWILIFWNRKQMAFMLFDLAQKWTHKKYYFFYRCKVR